MTTPPEAQQPRPNEPDPPPYSEVLGQVMAWQADNQTEACRHCPTPDVHPTRIGGTLTYEGRCDPDTCEKHDHAEVEAQQPRPNETATDTAKMVKARGVHMYREASDFSEHRMVSGILISPAEIHRIEREAAALAAERTAAVPSVDVERLTPERLANAMAAEGYADPDWTEQWTAPVEAARRILARVSPESDNGE